MHFYVSPFAGLWITSFIIWLISLVVISNKEKEHSIGFALYGIFEGLCFLIWSLFLLVATLIIGYFL